MSVSRDELGAILLAGKCPVEDAESLVQLLQESPLGPVDWTHCTVLHTAVLQVILAFRPELKGPCGDMWVQQWIIG